MKIGTITHSSKIALYQRFSIISIFQFVVDPPGVMRYWGSTTIIHNEYQALVQKYIHCNATTNLSFQDTSYIPYTSAFTDFVAGVEECRDFMVAAASLSLIRKAAHKPRSRNAAAPSKAVR